MKCLLMKKNNMDWQKVIKAFCGESYKYTEGDLIKSDYSPKSEIWIRLDPNWNRKEEIMWDTIRRCFESIKESKPYKDSKELLSLMFSIMIISEDEDRAIRAMKRFKPHRDWSLYEIDNVNVNGKTYYIVWD